MARIALTLVLVVAVITAQGAPTTYDEIVAAAKAGQWDHVQELTIDIYIPNESSGINGDFSKEASWKPVSFNNVRNLKPLQGGHVYGEAEYTFHSASNVNGQTSEDFGGHKVINHDGKVKEFDFTPSTDIPAAIQLKNFPLTMLDKDISDLKSLLNQ